MKNKISFIKSIRLWGILFLLFLASVLIVIDVSRSYRDVNMRADQVRTDYIEQQRQRINCEVERVVKLIDFETEHIIRLEQDRIKKRVYEAYAIAENIYQQHKSSKSSVENRQIIIDAIRPIRFDQVIGYSADVTDEGQAGKEKYLAAQNNGNSYDLVIMDLTIPGGMGGEEATKEILTIDPDAKVIATSGYSTDPIMARFLDYGFSGRILKPFRREDIKSEISRVLSLNS